MRCNPYNLLYNSCSKCLISKICSRVCLRVFLSCFLLFRKRRTSTKCDSSPGRKTDCFRWTNSSNLWISFQVTMGSNNMGEIFQRHYSAFSILSHSCNENFLLSFFMLKSVSHPLGVWDKVWRTHTQFTLFLFYKTVFFFSGPCYSCWIFLFFCRFEAENILVLFLNFVSVLACIELSMYRS